MKRSEGFSLFAIIAAIVVYGLAEFLQLLASCQRLSNAHTREVGWSLSWSESDPDVPVMQSA
jgi:hypothetical protein